MRLRIGTRGSKLAVAQSMWVKRQIELRHKDIDVELVKIKTKGDKILDSPLNKIGGKGLFVKEIESALLMKKIDMAVHSLKDVPFELPDGLEIGIYPKRENPLDAFISVYFNNIKQLPEGAKIGTSSLRRQVQLRFLYPHIRVVPVRGNVDTRLKKLYKGDFDGIILAAAGLVRLGLKSNITQIISEDIMIPAVGQGSLGIEIRRDDELLKKLLFFMNHRETEICVKAERSFLKELGGGCQIPIAGYAKIEDNKLIIKGMVSDIIGEKYLLDMLTGDINNPQDLGRKLAHRLFDKGAKDILRGIYE